MTEKAPFLYMQITECVRELVQQRMHVPELKARLHPEDFTRCAEEMYKEQFLPMHKTDEGGTKTYISTPFGRVEIMMDPTLTPGEFRLVSNRNDGMLNVLDCRFQRDEVKTEGDFAVQFQQFAGDRVGGPMILDSRIVYKTPMGTELIMLVRRIERLPVHEFTPWEKQFIHDVSERLVEEKRKLTSNQMQALAKVFGKYGV